MLSACGRWRENSTLEPAPPDGFTRLTRRFRIGLLDVELSHLSASESALGAASEQLEVLTRLLKGLADGQDVQTFARLLNGPTVDVLLDRPRTEPVKPCGCRGK